MICAEDAEVGFDFLVNPFHLPIGLRVVGSGEFDVIFEESSQFSGEGRGKLRASIRYQGIMYSEAFEDMGEKKLSYFHSIDGFGARDNDHPLCKAMVDHDQNRVHPTYVRKVGDEIYGELLKGEGCSGGDGVQRWANQVSVHFVLLAHSASFNEFVDKGS